MLSIVLVSSNLRTVLQVTRSSVSGPSSFASICLDRQHSCTTVDRNFTEQTSNFQLIHDFLFDQRRNFLVDIGSVSGVVDTSLLLKVTSKVRVPTFASHHTQHMSSQEVIPPLSDVLLFRAVSEYTLRVTHFRDFVRFLFKLALVLSESFFHVRIFLVKLCLNVSQEALSARLDACLNCGLNFSFLSSLSCLFFLSCFSLCFSGCFFFRLTDCNLSSSLFCHLLSKSVQVDFGSLYFRHFRLLLN